MHQFYKVFYDQKINIGYTNSHKWLRNNFSLQYEYNIRQSEYNKKY